MNSKSDAELVHLARAGNRGAYGELIRRYQHSIWGLAFLLLDDWFEAEDMTQEAFVRAWSFPEPTGVAGGHTPSGG